MRPLRRARFGLAAGAFGLAVPMLMTSPAARAQQEEAGPPPKPLVPVAASTLAGHADRYYGEHVSLSGAVEQSLSKLAFSVDQDKTKSTGNEVLVLPPRLKDEEAYAKIMKQVGPANAALRKALEGMDVKLARDNAAVLRQAFDEVEDFWKRKRRTDASTWAVDARKLAEAIERAAAGDNWADVKTTAGNLGKACQTCHTAYRERFDDGSFRIKGLGPQADRKGHP